MAGPGIDIEPRPYRIRKESRLGTRIALHPDEGDTPGRAFWVNPKKVYIRGYFN